MAVSKIRKSTLTIKEEGWISPTNEWTAPENGLLTAIAFLQASSTDNATWTYREVGGDMNLITLVTPKNTYAWLSGSCFVIRGKTYKTFQNTGASNVGIKFFSLTI